MDSAFLPPGLAELPIVEGKDEKVVSSWFRSRREVAWEADSPQADCRGLVDPDELE